MKITKLGEHHEGDKPGELDGLKKQTELLRQAAQILALRSLKTIYEQGLDNDESGSYKSGFVSGFVSAYMTVQINRLVEERAQAAKHN